MSRKLQVQDLVQLWSPFSVAPGVKRS